MMIEYSITPEHEFMRLESSSKPTDISALEATMNSMLPKLNEMHDLLQRQQFKKLYLQDKLYRNIQKALEDIKIMNPKFLIDLNVVSDVPNNVPTIEKNNFSSPVQEFKRPRVLGYSENKEVVGLLKNKRKNKIDKKKGLAIKPIQATLDLDLDETEHFNTQSLRPNN